MKLDEEEFDSNGQSQPKAVGEIKACIVTHILFHIILYTDS
jgi:hypothetical protein